MKKILLLIALVLLGTNLFSQKKNVQKGQLIKTEIDSLSYSFGVSMAQQGLLQYLTQKGLLSDTLAVKNNYVSLIEKEVDKSKATKLKKEMNFKLDSISKANKSSLTDFFAGFSSVVGANTTKQAYTEGLSLGGNISQMLPSFSTQIYGEKSGKEVNRDLFLLGFKNILENEKILVDGASELINRRMEAAQAKTALQKDAGLKADNAAYIAEGERFVEENKTKEGVVTLASGLQYKVITQGTGNKPLATNRVKVHYRGSLLNGVVFDSSYDRGEPIALGVTEVIPGWIEALQLMPVGSKWMLYVPYELGYGSRDMGKIKPFSNLIFEMELLSIEN